MGSYTKADLKRTKMEAIMRPFAESPSLTFLLRKAVTGKGLEQRVDLLFLQKVVRGFHSIGKSLLEYRRQGRNNSLLHTCSIFRLRDVHQYPPRSNFVARVFYFKHWIFLKNMV